MSDGVGRRLKAVAMLMVILIFLLASFTGMTAGKASARASQRAYMTAGPNTWEPMGFNGTGTTTRFIVDHMGWNVSRTFGNVGIGDGSIRAFNTSSNVNDINYTDKNYMAGDISTAPWDQARITDYSIPEEEHPEQEHEEENASSAEKNIGDADQEKGEAVSDNNIEKTTGGNQETNQTAGVGIGGNFALRDPYHTILLGRPIGDLLYEHPHAISANMYSRLVGLQVPGGSVANIGMRAIGYGY